MTTNEIKKAEQRGYARGYQRGLKARGLPMSSFPDTRVARHEPEAPYPCHFKCGRCLTSKYDRKAIVGWAWFTQYGERPVHFCPQCQASRADDVRSIRMILGIKPNNYPKERARL